MWMYVPAPSIVLDSKFKLFVWSGDITDAQSLKVEFYVCCELIFREFYLCGSYVGYRNYCNLVDGKTKLPWNSVSSTQALPDLTWEREKGVKKWWWINNYNNLPQGKVTRHHRKCSRISKNLRCSLSYKVGADFFKAGIDQGWRQEWRLTVKRHKRS